MKTIKDLVIQHKGIWPEEVKDCDSFVLVLRHPSGEREEINVVKSEFESCAKRMGYINGYRWGVEYPTNGKRPDLADDVIIRVKPIDGWSINREFGNVSEFIYDRVLSFKVIDANHKPSDTSYMDEGSEKPESINKAEYVSELRDNKPFDRKVSSFVKAAANKIVDDIMKKEPIGMSEKNWHERGELPPVGTVCEYDTGHKFDKCKIVAINGEAIAFTCEENENQIFVSTLDVACFRPIRTHREKVIEAASERVGGIVDLESLLNELYDAGMLVLPQDSSDTE